jgi:polyhydroxyalkanoate synthesis repressor PhaR
VIFADFPWLANGQCREMVFCYNAALHTKRQKDLRMSEPVRLIKKYPNRRLYDTKTSAYITLGDVKDLVLRFEVFKVIDAKTGDDLTRSILLQIILEEETGGAPLFSSELLSGFIRFYGSAMQGMLGKYLENNMKTFVDFQGKLQEQSRTVYGNDANMQADFWGQFLNFQQPAMQSMMTAYMDQSKIMFQQMQDQLQNQTRNMFTGFQVNPNDIPEK